MTALFTCLIVLQFLIIVSHDLIDIPGLIHGSQIQAQLGKGKVWLATLANACFPGIAAGFALYFWSRPRPGYVSNYWVIYCSIALLSAVGMWYVPYLRGASEKQKREYRSCTQEPATSCLNAVTIHVQIFSMWASTSCLW